MIDRTELLELLAPLGIDADRWAEAMADRILALDRQPILNLPEDDATLILNALAAYRKSCSRQANERITDLQARIIWRKEDAS